MKAIRRTIILTVMLIFSIAISSPARGAGVVYDVRAYGAIGDGENLDTEAINKAIEAAAEAGGGTVYFPAGTWL
jgi:polygalacturonase